MSFKNQVALYAIALKLYRMKNLVRGKSCLRILVSSFYFYGDRIQVEYANRLDYEGQRKTKEDKAHESVGLSENMKNLTILCRICKFNPEAENIEEEVIVNTEGNIDRNQRFVNGKAESYGIILRNV